MASASGEVDAGSVRCTSDVQHVDDAMDLAASHLPKPGPFEADESSHETKLASHLRFEHAGAYNPMTYRERILEDALEKWPVPVPAQLLRARLAAFKAEMADCNFRLEACACCARGKRPVKLRRVVFPPPDVAKPPAWLPCSDEEWANDGAEWHRQVAALLNTSSYLDRAFRVEDRVRDAQTEYESARCGRGASGVAAERCAAAWLARMRAWKNNLETAIHAVSVPAPGLPGKR